MRNFKGKIKRKKNSVKGSGENMIPHTTQKIVHILIKQGK